MPDSTMNYPYYVNPKDPSIYRVVEQLLRAQFADWQSFFKPIELQAMQQISFENPKVLTEAVQEAETTAAGTFDAMGGIMERQNRSLGVVPTEQQAQTSKRLIDLEKALAVAGAANTARQNVRAQDEQILFGTSPANINIGGMKTV